MKQLTQEQAIDIAKSGVWKEWTPEEVVKFQLWQKKLCMDFSYFQKCMEKVLKRPVYTHEFIAPELLMQEYLGERKPPTFEQIIHLIPPNVKTIIISV